MRTSLAAGKTTRAINHPRLICGGKLDAASRAILSRWRSLVEQIGLHSLLGGDFNIGAQALQDARFDAMWGATTCCPPAGTATCVTGTGSSQIDYFVANGPFVSELSRVSAVFASSVATHRPVVIEVPRSVCEECVLVISKPQSIPVEPVHGPHKRPPCWIESIHLAESAYLYFEYSGTY